MHRNLFALATLLAVLVAGSEARAACTAGNPNALVAESTPTSALADNNDGTVTHSLTGLMWKQCAEGLSGAGCATGTATTLTWAQALAAAKNSTFAGHSDWRLPNIKELESLVERCGYSPAINQTRFPATPASTFWSGSTRIGDATRAWFVRFSNGVTDAFTKSSTYPVRLVRGGQSFDYLDAQLNIAYSATTFTELANDGSISNGITLTLNGDTYAADVASANKITASNVPAGLTAHFARDSNTQITATLTGNAAAHANANDIANLTFTFADGAFTNTATAANVINYAKNNLVVDFADTAAIAYSATTFTESAANDGSISTSITLTLSGDTYAATVVSASKITASNVPTGLTATFVRDSNTQITATLTGNAAAHANANDISNLTFTFADGAFTNITSAATVTNYARNNLVVDFADQPAIAYSATTFSEAAANDGSISSVIVLTLSGDTYAGTVVSANKITAGNVPAGLAATFVRSSATVIIALLTGNAAAHANANDIGDLTFTFADGAFTNTPTAANVTNYVKNNLVVDFDPISDTTPDAFAFTAQVGVALSTATTSNTITVAGTNSVAAISINGGSYSVNGGAYVTGAGTVSNGDTVTVKQTSSASYSTATTATLTIGGVSAAFNVTTQAAPASAPAPSYDPGPYVPPAPTVINPAPTVINAPSSVVTTLTGTTPVNAAPGSTVVIPSGSASTGATIALPAPATGGAAPTPVTVTINGQNLTIAPTSAGAVLSVKTVTVNGVSTQVLSVSSGSVSVTASQPGQPLLAVGGGSGSNAVVITADTSGTAATSTVNAGTGETLIAVASGVVILPTNAFAEAGNGFAALRDGKLYAGEVAVLNRAGKISSVRLGTLAGNSTLAGDQHSQANTASLEYRTWVPLLDAVPARFGTTPKLADAIAALVNRDLPGMTYQGMQSDGSLRFGATGGRVANMLPVGAVEVDTSQPDGIIVDTHGKAKIATQGLITRFSTNSTDLPGFAASIRAGCPTCITVQLEDGNLHVTDGNVTYVGVADWYADATQGANGIGNNPDGAVSYTSAGLSQAIHPTAGDLEAILAAAQAIDAAAAVQTQSDGSVLIQINGNRYTLAPDFAMQSQAPAAHANDAWWLGADGRLYLKNRNGAVQGFTVR